MFRLLVSVLFLVAMVGDVSHAASAQDLQDAFVVFAESGDLDKVRTLFYKGSKVDGRDSLGRIALHEAAASGHMDVVRFLVEQGAQVNSRGSSGYTPLMRSIDAGQLAVVKCLVDKGASLWIRDSYGYLPLDLARRGPNPDVLKYLDTFYIHFELTERLMQHAAKGNIRAMKNMVDSGFSVNSKSPDGLTALMAAASHGRLNSVQWLLEHKANPNAVADNGVTALYAAVNHRYPRIVRCLLDNGAKVINPDKKALSVEPVARKNRDDELLKMLTARGRDEQVRDTLKSAYYGAEDVRKGFMGSSYEALTEAEIDIIRSATKKLLDSKVDWVKHYGDESLDSGRFYINLRSRFFASPSTDGSGLEIQKAMECLFSLACSADYYASGPHVDGCQIENYSDQINSKNRLGETPLMVLARCYWDDRSDETVRERLAVLDRFITAGADLNAQDVSGWTALMWAAFKGNKPVVQRLLERGADNGLTSFHGDTALSIATQLGYKNTAALIQTVKL